MIFLGIYSTSLAQRCSLGTCGFLFFFFLLANNADPFQVKCMAPFSKPKFQGS